MEGHLQRDVVDLYLQRDKAILRLEKELMTKAGYNGGLIVDHEFDDSQMTGQGWEIKNLTDDPSDPVLALYNNGNPVCTWYFSCRGAYQGGGYIVSTGEEFSADNLDEPRDQWVKVSSVCSQIARDALNTEEDDFQWEDDE